MNSYLVIFFASSAFLVGCVGGPILDVPIVEGNASFNTSQDINGTNPEGARFAIFGAFTFEEVGQSQLFIVASDQKDLCEAVSGGVFTFFDDALFGKITGPSVFLIVSKVGALPVDGDVIGEPDFLNVNYLVGDGTNLIGGGENVFTSGTMTVSEFKEGDTISLEVAIPMDSEIAGPDLVEPILFTGTVEKASHCQAVTDFVASGSL